MIKCRDSYFLNEKEQGQLIPAALRGLVPAFTSALFLEPDYRYIRHQGQACSVVHDREVELDGFLLVAVLPRTFFQIEEGRALIGRVVPTTYLSVDGEPAIYPDVYKFESFTGSMRSAQVVLRDTGAWKFFHGQVVQGVSVSPKDLLKVYPEPEDRLGSGIESEWYGQLAALLKKISADRNSPARIEARVGGPVDEVEIRGLPESTEFYSLDPFSPYRVLENLRRLIDGRMIGPYSGPDPYAAKVGEKMLRGLAEGREESARSRTESRERQEQEWIELARSKWPKHPNWPRKTMAEWIRKQSGTPRSAATIEKAIKGVKKKTLEESSDN